MNSECQELLADIRSMLAEANSLNENGQHGAAMKQAYHASEHVAVAYLLAATEKRLPPSDATFDMFSKIIQEPGRHPDFLSSIEGVVGDVYVLREAYEPALLDETTAQDARQMINCVTELEELARSM